MSENAELISLLYVCTAFTFDNSGCSARHVLGACQIL